MPNGIAVIKLMGRSSGYIAAYSTLAHGSVDLCLVPEVPVILDGPLSCLEHLTNVVAEKGYAVVVVAEGAGEELLGENAEVDAGGNKKLPKIGEVGGGVCGTPSSDRSAAMLLCLLSKRRRWPPPPPRGDRRRRSSSSSSSSRVTYSLSS